MRCVVGDDDQFGLTLAQGFQRLFVAEAVLARFHDEGQTGIDRLQGLFLWREEKYVALEEITSLLKGQDFIREIMI
jgi:hypothetical protein